MRLIPTAVCLGLLGLTVPAAAGATPTITCHCFKDREFDPKRPAAADPYLLANARNSLLAAAFGLEKAAVVRARMTGADGDDLWVSHWVSARMGADRERLLEAKEATGSWRAALAGLRLDPAKVGAGFVTSAAAGASSAVLAAEAADEVIASGWRVRREELKALRARGADTGDLVLALLVAARRREPIAKVYREKAGERSWGALLRDAGLEPRGIEAEVRKALSPGLGRG